MKKNYQWGVLMVVVAILMFFVGNWYGSQKKNDVAGGNNYMRAGGQFGGRGTGQGGNRAGNRMVGSFTRGEVVAKDASSLTLKLNDGGSKILIYSSSTLVNKMVNGSLDDVKVGENLMVSGDANPDGSITAKSLQLISSSTARF